MRPPASQQLQSAQRLGRSLDLSGMNIDSTQARMLAGELGERSREILRHLVDSYLSSGEPVGSRSLSQRLPHTLSPASIRNVMAVLEALGLLYAPHTSAGRVPTEKGLRLFA